MCRLLQLRNQLILFLILLFRGICRSLGGFGDCLYRTVFEVDFRLRVGVLPCVDLPLGK
nr:MAG: hypothetical protein [Bacteriophage sp.]